MGRIPKTKSRGGAWLKLALIFLITALLLFGMAVCSTLIGGISVSLADIFQGIFLEYDRDVAIVVGGEGGGVRSLTRKLCDGAISLPQLGKVNSLNASVACGILLYEAVRQRMQIGK